MNYILSGRTGSGLSTAKRTFERNGYLISYPRLSKFNPADYDNERKQVIVIDVNTAIADNQGEHELMAYYEEFLVKLRDRFKIIFLDAEDSVLFRRQHNDHLPPLYTEHFDVPWMQAFAMESKVLKPLSENAHFRFDSGQTAPAELAQTLDFYINLEMPQQIEANSYKAFLAELYHEDFWAHIGKRMTVFREIHAEPDAARHFLEHFDTKLKQPVLNSPLLKRIGKIHRIVITGMGSSFFTGQAAKEIMQKQYRVSLPLDCIPLSEISFGDLKDVLIIINSNSGETGEIKQCVSNKLFEPAAGIFGLTNYPNSFLGRYCTENKNSLLFPLDVPEEDSIPATVSVTANLMLLCGLIALLQDAREPKADVTGKYLADVEPLPDVLSSLLSQGTLNQIYSWARSMADYFQHGVGYVVGCGLMTSILAEVALKGIELAKVQLTGLPHSFAHGPLNSANMEAAIYLQDTLTDQDVIRKHLEKLVQHCPVFSIGPYWQINLPNLSTFSCHGQNPTLSVFAQLMVMQLTFAVFAMIKGLSVKEICQPSMLQKVVLSSPIS